MRNKPGKLIHSLKSWLFTPGTKADRFGRAAESHADALIIDLEDAVAPSAEKDARAMALKYLEGFLFGPFPCALRINAPTTRVGLDDPQSLLGSSAEPDYLLRMRINIAWDKQEYEVPDYPGLASDPFTWDDAVEKFDSLVAGRVGHRLSAEIKDAARSVESIQVRDLMKLLGSVKAGHGAPSSSEAA